MKLLRVFQRQARKWANWYLDRNRKYPTEYLLDGRLKEHKGREWKVVSSKEIIFNGKLSLPCVSVLLLADFLKYAIDETTRIGGNHDGNAGISYIDDTYDKIAEDYISICNEREYICNTP